mgnify:FL=1
MRTLLIIIDHKLTNFFYKVKEVIKSSLKNFLNYKSIRDKKKFIKSSLSFLSNWGKPIKYKANNKNVLIDCMWNNPNYWFRYVLVRNSLKLYESNQFALFGQYSINLEELICRTFNFQSLGSLFNRSKPKIKDLQVAIKLMQEVKNANDFLNIKLPYSFPASVLYDGILKKQYKATIDLSDQKITYYLAECISYLHKANSLINKYKFSLILLSHCQEYTYASLAWLATRKNIPVYVLYGEFGTCRFFYLSKPNDIFAYPSRPNTDQIKLIPSNKKNIFISEGKKLIRDRFQGKSDDPGSLLAYVERNVPVDKIQICKRYNWLSSKPIIGVYCSNWFDYPHGSGLKTYTDFKDWIFSVINVAKINDSVNWLFKSHPCDKIYPSLKGETINDLLENLNLNHIKVASEEWTGIDLIKSLDGITTCHGTIGFEATILGKPVLVPYSGWYADLGFVQNASGKKNYLKILNSKWYLKKPIDRQIELCAISSAIYFGKPAWQKFVFEDDIYQDRIYKNLKQNIIHYDKELKKEIRVLKSWFKSKTKYYQVYKKINY